MKPRPAAPDPDRSFFRQQALRLTAAQYFPAIDEGVTELIDSLMRVSRKDQDRAKRIIDQALTSQKCPTPADLGLIAEGLRVAETRSALDSGAWYTTGGLRSDESIPHGCEKCEGTGWMFTAGSQVLCGCELGRFLKTVERKQMERTA